MTTKQNAAPAEAVEEYQAPQIVTVAIEDITPYDNNPRLNDEAVEKVKESIEEFGFLVPLVLDGDGVIITGHTRFLALKELGKKNISAIYATHLTEEQVKAYRLADNKVAEFSTWDEAKLAEEMQQLQSMGVDLSTTGFSKAELDCLCGFVDEDSLDDLDYAAVCGAVSVEQKRSVGLTVSFNMGSTFKFKVPVDKYLEWEKQMLERFGTQTDATNYLMKQLGFEKTNKED